MIVNHRWNCGWVKETQRMLPLLNGAHGGVVPVAAAVWQLEECGAEWGGGVGLTP